MNRASLAGILPSDRMYHSYMKTTYPYYKLVSKLPEIGPVLYYASFAIYALTYCFSKTLIGDSASLNIDNLYDSGRVICAILLIIKLLCQKYSRTQMAGVVFVGLSVLASVYVSRDWNLALLFLFIVAGQRISLKKLAAISIPLIFGVVLVTILLASDGYISSKEIYRTTEGAVQLRTSLGFIHPNQFGQLVLAVCCSSAVLRFREFSIFDLAIYVCAAAIVYIYANSQTTVVCIILVAVLSLFARCVSSWKHAKFFLLLMTVIVVSCAMVSYFFMLFYDSNIAWMKSLDSVFSARFSLANYYYQHYPPVLFGRRIENLVYISGSYVQNGPDNAFVRMLLQDGIVPTILFLLLYIASAITLFHKRHFNACVLGIIIYAFVALMETNALHFAVNYYFLSIAWMIYGFDSEISQEKDTSVFLWLPIQGTDPKSKRLFLGRKGRADVVL